MMDDQLKSNLTSSKHWIRLLFMVLFALALQVASFVMTVLVVVQFLFSLITGSDNIKLRKFGDSLSTFIFGTLQFLIYNSEDKPFPFSDWPESSVDGSEAARKTAADSDAGNKEAEAKPKRKTSTKKKTTTKKSAAKSKPDSAESESGTGENAEENANQETPAAEDDTSGEKKVEVSAEE